MQWHIHDHSSGCVVETIEARTAREALLKYMIEHEELDDMMIWKSADRDDAWKIAPYDEEDNFLYARMKIEAGGVWELFTTLPMSADLKLVDKEGKVLAESYGRLIEDRFDNAKIVSVKPDPNDSDMYVVTVEIEEEEE